MKQAFHHLIALLSVVSLTACAAGSAFQASVGSTSPTPAPAPTATPVPALVINQKTIAAGTEKTFSILSAGRLKSTGRNTDSSNGSTGQLGLGLSTGVAFSSLQTSPDTAIFAAVVSGEITSCGITTAGMMKCWGDSAGTGGSGFANTPTAVVGSDVYVDVASGSYHSCGVTTTGVMKCWGDGWEGKLGNGDGTGAGQNSPVVADSGTLYKRVAAGRNHTCGITSGDKIRCFGTGSAGQLGDGSTSATPRLVAVDVDATTSYREIAAGEDTTCAITTTGILKCWGANGEGQLGDGSQLTRSSPTVIDTGVSYAKISTAASFNYHTCGLTSAGIVKCWGSNSVGQIGNAVTGGRSLSPVAIDGVVTYSEISVSFGTSCGLTTGGAMKCWGRGTGGQLGTGNNSNQNVPTPVL